jgi:translation elongation factor EF-Tu-like GTPase
MGSDGSAMAVGFTIEVELHFLAPEHGGKAVPVYSGYRPQLHHGNHDWNVVVRFANVESVRGGQVVRAAMEFVGGAAHPGQIEVGAPFILHEARRTVAYGRVLEIPEAR